MFSDWLVSRRHCNKDWQKNVLAIREKIKHAILDMPESQKIVQLLQGACKTDSSKKFTEKQN